MAKSIYVGNLSYGTTEEGLQDLFAPYGDVVSVKIISDRETGRSKGFGFVEMEDDDAAGQAIEALNETEYDGRKLKVNFAKPRPERRSSYNRY